MCPWILEITRATARCQRSLQPPAKGFMGKPKSLTAPLLPPVDWEHWGLWDNCGLKKRCLGLDLQSLQGYISSSLQTTKHVNRPAVGAVFGPQGAQFKGKHTNTWPQDERPRKGTGLFYMTHMHANKAIKLGVSAYSNIQKFGHTFSFKGRGKWEGVSKCLSWTIYKHGFHSMCGSLPLAVKTRPQPQPRLVRPPPRSQPQCHTIWPNVEPLTQT